MSFRASDLGWEARPGRPAVVFTWQREGRCAPDWHHYAADPVFDLASRAAGAAATPARAGPRLARTWGPR